MAQELDLSFGDVCKLLKKEFDGDPALIGAVESLLGMATVCSFPCLDPVTISAVLPVFTVGNEVTKLGRKVFAKLTGKKDSDYLQRYDRMQLAYTLIVFTAFFGVVDEEVPKSLRDKLRITPEEKKGVTKKAMAAKADKRETDAGAASLIGEPVSFLHPFETLDGQVERHTELWERMGRGFARFIQGLATWENAGEKEQRQLLSWQENIGEKAAKHFAAQYVELAGRFGEFAVWANLHEHKMTKKQLGGLSREVREYAALAKADKTSIDAGFARLGGQLLSIPETIAVSRAEELAEELKTYYRNRLSDPIFKEIMDHASGIPNLKFPKIRDVFIPQSYKTLRYESDVRLEDEEAWAKREERNDLDAFMVNYLSLPHSMRTPLLLLGHPGGGKSLLSTVLSAQLMTDQFTTICVRLREVAADAKIADQIDEAISQITQSKIDPWRTLAKKFRNAPPLIILDGYDELLQASDKVFKDYLKDVREFQESQLEQGHPVRVIVTSRLTLIDKVAVPAGAMALRLMEFDDNRRKHWIRIWNETNSPYFQKTKLKPFAIPSPRKKGADRILALAEQPLLLVMLAIYDAADNALGKKELLDRTLLYNNLLRLFVSRELIKNKEYRRLQDDEQAQRIDDEMFRLGVAALGMYNRRQVHILRGDLDGDLCYFEPGSGNGAAERGALTPANLLLGSFFFIHQSRAKHDAGAREGRTEAFEFLHNTFGEFLTADFILRQVLDEVEAQADAGTNRALRSKLKNQMDAGVGLGDEWYVTLMYTPLFTRPVILEMMREWIVHLLKQRELSGDKYQSQLGKILLNQLDWFLNKQKMPRIFLGESSASGRKPAFTRHPLLGHIAVYTVNLVLLRITTCDSGMKLDESAFDAYEDGARPWDRLTHLWRSWFSLDALANLAVIMRAKREDSVVRVVSKDNARPLPDGEDRLETYRLVSNSLADRIAGGLVDLMTFNPGHQPREHLKFVVDTLAQENVRPTMHILLNQVFMQGRGVHDTATLEEYLDYTEFAMTVAMDNDNPLLLGHIVHCVLHCFKRLAADNVDLRNMEENYIRYFGSYNSSRIFSTNPLLGTIWLLAIMEIPQPYIRSKICESILTDLLEYEIGRRIIRDNPEILILLNKMTDEFTLLGRGQDYQRSYSRKYQRSFTSQITWDLGPDELSQMFSTHPDAVVSYLRLNSVIRRKDGSHWYETHIIDIMFDMLPYVDTEQSGVKTFPILQFLTIFREFGPREAIPDVFEILHRRGYVEHLLQPRNFFALAQENPDAARFFLSLLQSHGKSQPEETRLRYNDDLSGLISDSKYSSYAIMKAKGNIFLAWLEQACQSFRGTAFKRDIHALLDITVHLSYDAISADPELFAAVLMMTRMTGDIAATRKMEECLLALSESPADLDLFVRRLPLGVKKDLLWLKQKQGSSRLDSLISRILD